MWTLFVLVLISIYAYAEEDKNVPRNYLDFPYQKDCIADRAVVSAFRKSYDDFAINLTKTAVQQGYDYVTISPLLIWITLAAVAEGADQQTQSEIFKVLNLPTNFCSRQKFYFLATSRIAKYKYVTFDYNRVLFIDQDGQLNIGGYKLYKTGLLHVIPVPIKRNPGLAFETIKHIIPLQTLRPKLTGNSVLANSMDYYGLWTFDGAKVERSPFYNESGSQIGFVDLMRIKLKVRIGYLMNVFSKVIELPVGLNQEYRMLFGYNDSNVTLSDSILNMDSNAIFDMVSSLEESPVPVAVAIPTFVITSEMDIKDLIQSMGIVKLWTDPAATSHISSPPAEPQNFIQRVTVDINSKGILPPPITPAHTQQQVTEENKYWYQFVANRPFAFALYEAETFTNIMATLYTRPTYPN